MVEWLYKLILFLPPSEPLKNNINDNRKELGLAYLTTTKKNPKTTKKDTH